MGLMALATLLMSCAATASTDAKSGEAQTAQAAPSKGEVVVLTKADFLAKVYNYEKNPDQWVYEGDKP